MGIIQVKNLIDEDFLQYRMPTMFIGFPTCSFKCGNENCQNYALKDAKNIEISTEEIVRRYLSNNITKAIVFGGLEPFDSPKECLMLCRSFREKTQDNIIIYTGYTEEEVKNTDWFQELIACGHIIIKFGRYIPNQETHYDELLGITLASLNQYSKEY